MFCVKILVFIILIDFLKFFFISLEIIFFIFWIVFVVDCDGVLLKFVIVKKYIYKNNLLLIVFFIVKFCM